MNQSGTDSPPAYLDVILNEKTYPKMTLNPKNEENIKDIEYKRVVSRKEKHCCNISTNQALCCIGWTLFLPILGIIWILWAGFYPEDDVTDDECIPCHN